MTAAGPAAGNCTAKRLSAKSTTWTPSSTAWDSRCSPNASASAARTTSRTRSSSATNSSCRSSYPRRGPDASSQKRSSRTEVRSALRYASTYDMMKAVAFVSRPLSLVTRPSLVNTGSCTETSTAPEILNCALDV